jgi:hypothetical protein
MPCHGCLVTSKTVVTVVRTKRRKCKVHTVSNTEHGQRNSTRHTSAGGRRKNSLAGVALRLDRERAQACSHVRLCQLLQKVVFLKKKASTKVATAEGLKGSRHTYEVSQV